MSYFRMTYYDSLKHSDTAKKRDLNGTSVSDEKGTDNKANNTSAYNHEYYMKNKDKWGVKEQDGTDISDSDFNEKNRIGGTDFFAKKDKNGNWVIFSEDRKWVLPEGKELTSDLKKKISDTFENIGSGPVGERPKIEDIINAESSNFDVDAAALDVIRGKYGNGQARKDALGDDFDMVQKRVNEMYAEGRFGGGSSNTSSNEKSEEKSSTKSTSSVGNNWYNATDKKIMEAKKKQEEKNNK